MLETTPLRRPRQGTLPTPSTVIPSPSTSPTTAETLVVPRSSPTTISGEFSLFVATCALVFRGFCSRPFDADTSDRGRTNFLQLRALDPQMTEPMRHLIAKGPHRIRTTTRS